MQPVIEPNLNVAFTYKDILFRKLYNAIIYSVLSQLFVLHFVLIVVRGELLNPLLWLKTSYYTVTSPSAWLLLIPHMLIIFAQCLICAKDYVLSSSYSSTRFQKFISIFSLHNMVLLMLHGLVGVVQVWLALRLGTKSTDGEEKESFWIEETLFLLQGGLWIGLYYFAKVYVSDKHLEFPVIQQKKFTQLRSNLLVLLRESFKQSLYPCLYYITFYYLWGGEFKQNFSFIFELKTETELSFKVYLLHWFFASLFFFNMNLIKLFFGLFLTEVVEFPLSKQPNVLTLQESINMQKLPIIQRLACLDLCVLSSWSPLRRQILFSLSQPGEHPHNWNSLIESILKLYNTYIEILDQSMGNIPEKPVINQLATPTTKQFRNLRNMTSPFYDNSRIHEAKNPIHEAKHPKPQIKTESLMAKLHGKILNFVTIIKTILGINYFFGEIPQGNIQKCLSNGNLIIWSSQGLSELICASLTEDVYGVVQKDLAIVVTTLVRLCQVLDKLNKIPALSKRVVGSDNFNYKIKNAISSSVKRSLFNICNTFRNYLREIHLNKETTNYLYSTVLVKNSV